MQQALEALADYLEAVRAHRDGRLNSSDLVKKYDANTWTEDQLLDALENNAIVRLRVAGETACEPHGLAAS